MQGNTVGTDASGTADLGNLYNGVALLAGARNNIIGGNAAGAGNLLSGNGDNGLLLYDAGTEGNVVQGNRIGVNAAGTGVLGNSTQGIWVGNGAANNTIGGTTAGSGNVIGGNAFAGIEIGTGGGSGNVVQGNFVGTDASGTLNLGNGNGILLGNGAVNNRVGGVVAGEGNTVAFNTFAGVVVTDAGASGNSVLGNRIHSNGTLGIDLGNFDGVTANDAGDGDAGPNGLQNFPVLASARTDGASQITLTGTLNSSANSHYRIEFFASAAADSSGHGEGQRLLGFTNVSTDSAGNASFSTTLLASVAVGESISATATRSDNTFSLFPRPRNSRPA
ncbi:MAG: hypothetical protein HC793_02120 [Aquincola sp.]|nr:hypothetical protein [Aquincola sp.]